MNTLSQTSRQSLHFAECVRKSFTFLGEHGFQIVESEPTFVQFRSDLAYVNIYHGRHSFEIGLEVGSLDSKSTDNALYSVSEVMRLFDGKAADNYRNYASHTVSGVADGVKRLAQLFHTYVDTGMLDSESLFDRLRRQRKLRNHLYAKEVDLEHARALLPGYWRDKKYSSIVKLLQPLRDDLHPSELKKLEYAERKLQ